MTATDDTPVIRLQQVTKRFGREVALDQVSLDVPRGAAFALLGENGARPWAGSAGPEPPSF